MAQGQVEVLYEVLGSTYLGVRGRRELIMNCEVIYSNTFGSKSIYSLLLDVRRPDSDEK